MVDAHLAGIANTLEAFFLQVKLKDWNFKQKRGGNLGGVQQREGLQGWGSARLRKGCWNQFYSFVSKAPAVEHGGAPEFGMWGPYV